jgi:adenylate kinase
MLGDLCRHLSGAIYLDVPDEEIIRRISGRRYCPTCQASYHILFKKPKQEGLCDVDGAPLEQREDDDPDTVKARLKVFHGQTLPVVDYYRQAGLLIEVPAAGEVDEVDELLANMLQPFKRHT